MSYDYILYGERVTVKHVIYMKTLPSVIAGKSMSYVLTFIHQYCVLSYYYQLLANT